MNHSASTGGMAEQGLPLKKTLSYHHPLAIHNSSDFIAKTQCTTYGIPLRAFKGTEEPHPLWSTCLVQITYKCHMHIHLPSEQDKHDMFWVCTYHRRVLTAKCKPLKNIMNSSRLKHFISFPIQFISRSVDVPFGTSASVRIGIGSLFLSTPRSSVRCGKFMVDVRK